MTSTFTSNLNIEKPGTGDQQNTWGTTVNSNMDLVDKAFGSNNSKSVAGGADVTATTTEAQSAVQTLTGALTASINYILPAIGRFWFIDNQTTGAFTITVKTSGGSGVICPQGKKTLVFCDGTNIVYGGHIGEAVNAQTGTTYTVLASDFGKLVTLSNASAVAVTLPQAATATFPAGWHADFVNLGAGTVTITPTTSTIDGAASLTLSTNEGVHVVSDGTNYIAVRGRLGGTLTYTLAMSGASINEAKGSNIASATTTDIGAATGNYVQVTGTTTITGLGTVQAGTRRIVEFAASLTLTHNATSLILPGGANITTAAGDVAVFVSEGSGNWRCIGYQKASGASVTGIVQLVTATIAAASGTTTISQGSTAPASTDGTQIVSASITPASTSNKVRVRASFLVSASTTMFEQAAVFRGTTCIGLASTYLSTGTANAVMAIEVIDSPASVSSQTYSIRIGNDGTGTWYVSQASAHTFGGVPADSIMSLEEIQ